MLLMGNITINNSVIYVLFLSIQQSLKFIIMSNPLSCKTKLNFFLIKCSTSIQNVFVCNLLYTMEKKWLPLTLRQFKHPNT